MTDPNDILFGSSVPTAKFKTVGDSVTGTIVKLDSSQQREYRRDGQPGALLTWPDGRPKMQVIVTLQTAQRDPAVQDDDGRRRVFVKGKQLTNAVRDAVRQAGAQRLDDGGTLTVTFTGEEPSDWGGSPAKLFGVRYVKPSGADAAAAALGLEQPAVQQNTPVAQTVTTGQQTLDLSGVSPEAAAKLRALLAEQNA